MSCTTEQVSPLNRNRTGQPPYLLLYIAGITSFLLLDVYEYQQIFE
jgi:hypothetical protein